MTPDPKLKKGVKWAPKWARAPDSNSKIRWRPGVFLVIAAVWMDRDICHRGYWYIYISVLVRWRRSSSFEEPAASMFSEERTRMPGTPLMRFNNILMFPSGVNLKNKMA